MTSDEYPRDKDGLVALIRLIADESREDSASGDVSTAAYFSALSRYSRDVANRRDLWSEELWSAGWPIVGAAFEAALDYD